MESTHISPEPKKNSVLPPAAVNDDTGEVSTATNTSMATATQVNFKKGEKIKVWSSSQNAWLDGVVKEIFTTETTHENYAVPAGVIKVESAAGIKFIQPEQAGKLLRKEFPRTD